MDLVNYIGAAAIATLLTFYGAFYVFLVGSARDERAGFTAALGLALGLMFFGAFPVVDIILRFAQMTQYYQYVRVIVVVLALVIAFFVIMDFRIAQVYSLPRAWSLIRIFIIGLLMHLITPLPYEFYNHLLNNGGFAEVAGNIFAELTGSQSPFANPLRTFTLPLVAFLVYSVIAFVAHWVHEGVQRSDILRYFIIIFGVFVFVGVAIWVSFRGLTYDPGILDKITNFGLNNLL